jgi:hypothetical protein
LIQLQERRKIYRFEVPVVSSELGAPIKFEIQTKFPLARSPLEGYELLDDMQEGPTRTNHLGYVGTGVSLGTKILYIVLGCIIGVALTFAFTQCSNTSGQRHMAPAANPDSIVENKVPTVNPEDKKATVTDITPEPTPAEPAADEKATVTDSDVDSSLGLKDAIKYLDDNTVWVRDDMERNAALKGLFDDMNNYRLDRIMNVWAAKFKDSERMAKLAKHAQQGSKNKKAKLDGTYNEPNDNRISVQGYLNRIDP